MEKFPSAEASQATKKYGKGFYLSEIGTRDQLFEQINQKLFESLLRAHLSRNAAESQPSASTVTLSTDELNVLRYIGGYIFKKISTKYDQKVDEVSHQVCVLYCRVNHGRRR